MIFLTKTDIEQRMTANILTMITGGDDTLIDNAEVQAIGVVKDMLSGLYDIDSELIKTNTDRHANLRNWLVSLSVYYLYAHIPDNEVPQRTVKDYDDTLSLLTKIAQGKIGSSLTPVNKDDGSAVRVVRYGFDEKRSHKIM